MIQFKRLLAIFAPRATRAADYLSEVRPNLENFAKSHGAEFREIAVENLPFRETSKLVAAEVKIGDLVVVAGGDGLANAALDGSMKSGAEPIFATVPLGQMNDFAHSLNGRHANPDAILAANSHDFYPLEIRLNFKSREPEKIFVSQYISFGATAVLSDWLNSDQIRDHRKKDKNPFGSVLLGARHIRPLARAIAKLELINFRRDGTGWSLNSVGFFLGSAGNLFRLRGAKNLTFSEADFFYHQTNFDGQVLASAREFSSWLLAGLPGEISDDETITFDKPTTLRGQIGGDCIEFANVTAISAARSAHKIAVLARK